MSRLSVLKSNSQGRWNFLKNDEKRCPNCGFDLINSDGIECPNCKEKIIINQSDKEGLKNFKNLTPRA